MPPRTRNASTRASQADKGKGKVAESSSRASKQGESSRAPRRRRVAVPADVPEEGIERAIVPVEENYHVPQHEPSPEPALEQEPDAAAEPPTVLSFFTNVEKDNYHIQTRLRHEGTRYLHFGLLDELQIRGDVELLIANMGLTKFASLRTYAYPKLARQFFASVELVYWRERKQKPDEGVLRFKLDCQRCEVTIAELCEIYGFNYGSEARFRSFPNQDEFWEFIAQGKTTGTTKMSLIRSPVIRVVAKFLANTLFARTETGTIKAPEICLLFRALYPLMQTEDGPLFEDYLGTEINLGCLFAKELERTRAWSKKTREVSNVMCGIISPLIQYCLPNLNDYRCNRTNILIDGYMLRQYKIIYEHQDRDFFVYLSRDNKKKKLIDAPCPQYTSV